MRGERGGGVGGALIVGHTDRDAVAGERQSVRRRVVAHPEPWPALHATSERPTVTRAGFLKRFFGREEGGAVDRPAAHGRAVRLRRRLRVEDSADEPGALALGALLGDKALTVTRSALVAVTLDRPARLSLDQFRRDNPARLGHVEALDDIGPDSVAVSKRLGLKREAMNQRPMRAWCAGPHARLISYMMRRAGALDEHQPAPTDRGRVAALARSVLCF